MFNLSTKSAKHHAIVIGAGISGLLTAQVLSKYFERVTIVDRDNLPEQSEHRKGVPQARYPHSLLNQGQRILEQLFPGIEFELVNAGALTTDVIADYQWFMLEGWAPRFSSDMIIYNCTRDLLELTVRHRLVANNQIVFIQAAQVTNLLFNESRTRVTGVQVRFCNQSEINLNADLIVDASGRNSRAPQWLEAVGYTSPQQTVVKSCGYACRWYQCLENFQINSKGIGVYSKPPDTIIGFLYRVEKNCCCVAISNNYPGLDEARFLELVRGLRVPHIYEAIKNAQPISPVYSYGCIDSYWRHYENLSKLPEGFVVVGDAVCTLNPIYAQGMSVATLGALTLDKCLSKYFSHQDDGNLIGLPQHFQKQLSKVITTPWMISTSEDVRRSLPENVQSNYITRFIQTYTDSVRLLSIKNANILKVCMEIQNLRKSPNSLFHPYIMLRVLQHLFKERALLRE
ncbi:2-polyprenyl-6-methoxyphenol hydroxylase-like oxidoreductase [Nostoc sp. XA013]|nr:2-polyprenyl-6-methoxyphenol hydroxylase-like oxidoreductase [Nostoc sp. XA013]